MGVELIGAAQLQICRRVVCLRRFVVVVVVGVGALPICIVASTPRFVFLPQFHFILRAATPPSRNEFSSGRAGG